MDLTAVAAARHLNQEGLKCEDQESRKIQREQACINQENRSPNTWKQQRHREAQRKREQENTA